ncbi:hypothetical protein MMPV_009339 [Pyropia vietnamensis]
MAGPNTHRGGLFPAVLSLVVAVAAVAASVATPASAATAVGPTPSPRLVEFIKDSGEECVREWAVTGTDPSTDSGWKWESRTACCPPKPDPKTMITYDKGRRCQSVWTPCRRTITTDGRCVWRMCDVKTCPDPPCPSPPPTMKTRWTDVNGRRCVKKWYACAKHYVKGVCSWRGCDYIKCKPPCPKPMTKNMETVKTPTKTCMEAWWPVKVIVDHSTDEQVCTWKWKDAKTCHCKQDDGVWIKC